MAAPTAPRSAVLSVQNGLLGTWSFLSIGGFWILVDGRGRRTEGQVRRPESVIPTSRSMARTRQSFAESDGLKNKIKFHGVNLLASHEHTLNNRFKVMAIPSSLFLSGLCIYCLSDRWRFQRVYFSKSKRNCPLFCSWYTYCCNEEERPASDATLSKQCENSNERTVVVRIVTSEFSCKNETNNCCNGVLVKATNEETKMGWRK